LGARRFRKKKRGKKRPVTKKAIGPRNSGVHDQTNARGAATQGAAVRTTAGMYAGFY